MGRKSGTDPSLTDDDITNYLIVSLTRSSKKEKIEHLRSWVQIPLSPFFTILEIRHKIELISGSCRTKPIS